MGVKSDPSLLDPDPGFVDKALVCDFQNKPSKMFHIFARAPGRIEVIKNKRMASTCESSVIASISKDALNVNSKFHLVSHPKNKLEKGLHQQQYQDF